MNMRKHGNHSCTNTLSTSHTLPPNLLLFVLHLSPLHFPLVLPLNLSKFSLVLSPLLLPLDKDKETPLTPPPVIL